MNEENEYKKELAILTEQRKLESDKANAELSLEKQRTKTERAKHGTAKFALKIVFAVLASILLSVVATWFISMFLPQNVGNAIETFKGIFK